VTQRWSLLSNSPAWETFGNIRAVVANPRSYCYLDARRMNGDMLEVPDLDDVQLCSHYNQWQWGLDQGGNLTCPYKDQALQETPADKMAQRYAMRQVIYLSGEFDTLPAMDRCETSVFQGPNRQERAKNYVKALEGYFGQPVHELHIVPGSPHDHSLMFQSRVGRQAIFGKKESTEIE
jgi:hypothetical protein